MSKDIRVIITADSTNAEKALARVDQALSGLSQQTNRQIGTAQGFQRLGQNVKGVGDQSRYAREQMQNLSYQMTDIVTGLATGQNPFFVLLQQGGQLRDIFGGTLPALRAVASVFTIARVAAGGLAAAIGAVVVAQITATLESEKLQDALRVTGNRAAVTAGEFDQMALALGESTRLGASDVRALGMELLSTGNLSASAFEPALRAMSTFAKASGMATDEVSKQFAGLSGDTSRWALDFARKYRAIDAATLDHIRSLQAQGDKMGAVKVASDAIAASMEQRQAKSLFAIVRLWNDATSAMDKYWERLKNNFRDATPESNLADLRKQLELAQASTVGGDNEKVLASREKGIARLKEQIKQAEDVLREQNRLRQRSAELQAEDDKARERNTAEYQGVIATNERAAAELRLTRQQEALEQARRLYRDAFRRGEVDAAGYQAALYQIDAAGIDARIRLAQENLAAELSVKPSTPQETEAQGAKRLAFERELTELRRERAALDDAERSGERTLDAGPTEALRDQLRSLDSMVEEMDTARWRRALDTNQRLIESNKDLAVELITNDEARVAAQLALEEERLRKELDLTVLSVEDRKKAEAAFAEWRVNRARQLNDQIRPAWERQLEQWRDVNQLMRQASDETWSGVLSNAEDAFARLAQTGKLSLSSLINDFIAARARLVFRDFMGGLSKGDLGGSWVGTALSFLGMGGGRAYGGDAHRGMLHPINERGTPEIVTIRGQDYLATGAASGKVTPMRPTSRSVNAVINQTNYIDSRSDAGQVAQIASQAVQAGQQQLLEQLRSERVLG